ncbi:MAG: hypothetical protein AB7K41_15160 [Bdellovibrionales bacterium]
MLVLRSLLFYLFLSCLPTTSVWAAACCGGNFASPGMISGDEKGLLTLSYSQSQVAEFADRNGYWTKQNGINEQIAQLSGARLLGDRWQIGTMASLKQQTRSEQSAQATDLGDTSVLLGYEALPEWVYDPYVPHGFVFLQITAPTGVSRYESREAGSVDVTGNGFWTLGGGVLLAKTWSQWDAQTQMEMHQGLPRDFSNPSYGQIHVTPSWGGSALLSGGYSVQDWRVGLGLRHSDEGPAKTTGSITSISATKRLTTLILSANYVVQQKWAFAVAYSDDTLLGEPTNSFLSRAITVSLQHRWAR